MIVRDYRETDFDACMAINQANVPEVGSVDSARMAVVLGAACLNLVAEQDGEICAFLVCMDQTADYDSPNYLWFRARHDRFAYVDRVAVSASARGLGVGRSFYEAVIAYAEQQGSAWVCAEVNERPPNPGSMAFHERMGFVPAGRLESDGGTKAVVMYERPIP